MGLPQSHGLHGDTVSGHAVSIEEETQLTVFSSCVLTRAVILARENPEWPEYQVIGEALDVVRAQWPDARALVDFFNAVAPLPPQ